MPDSSHYWYLRSSTIFEGLDEDTIRSVEQSFTTQTFRKNDFIKFPGETNSALFVLKDGHVKITRVTPDGKEMILDIVGPGEILGEMTLVDDDDEPSETAQALDEVVICSIHRREFERLMERFPELKGQIAKRISLRLRKIEDRMSDMLFKDVRKRIASFLVRHTEQFGKIKQQLIFLRPYLSHQDIALLTGSTRQTVTTTLNEFRTQGIIDFSRKGFTINDYNKLKQLAG